MRVETIEDEPVFYGMASNLNGLYSASNIMQGIVCVGDKESLINNDDPDLIEYARYLERNRLIGVQKENEIPNGIIYVPK